MDSYKLPTDDQLIKPGVMYRAGPMRSYIEDTDYWLQKIICNAWATKDKTPSDRYHFFRVIEFTMSLAVFEDGTDSWQLYAIREELIFLKDIVNSYYPWAT